MTNRSSKLLAYCRIALLSLVGYHIKASVQEGDIKNKHMLSECIEYNYFLIEFKLPMLKRQRLDS